MGPVSASGGTATSAAIALQVLQASRAGGRASGAGSLGGRFAGVAAASASQQVTKADAADGLSRAIRIGQKNAVAVAKSSLSMSYATAAKLALAMEAQGEAMVASVPNPLSTFAPRDARQMAELGADAAVEVVPFQLDDAAFADLVGLNAIKEYKDQPGFADAMAAGDVVIRRASEVPEFNFGHRSFLLFAGGSMIGGAGWGKPFNQALYDRVAATGVQQAFGGVMGQEYYVTWPATKRPEAV